MEEEGQRGRQALNQRDTMRGRENKEEEEERREREGNTKKYSHSQKNYLYNFPGAKLVFIPVYRWVNRGHTCVPQGVRTEIGLASASWLHLATPPHHVCLEHVEN